MLGLTLDPSPGFRLGPEKLRVQKEISVAETERSYLPAAGYHWSLPLYDPIVKLLGVTRQGRCSSNRPLSVRVNSFSMWAAVREVSSCS